MGSTVKDSDVRFGGNQYGHWIRIQGATLEKIERACAVTGETVEQFVIRALRTACER